jgi:hypothetical protein
MFEEVDKLIVSLREEQEMKDYLERNIYPERLIVNHTIKYIPPIIEKDIPDIQCDDLTPYYDSVKNKLNIIDNLIYSLKSSIQDTCETCPICICEITDTNVMIPSCGHKTCIRCFTSNLIQNKHTGNLCSICRSVIV